MASSPVWYNQQRASPGRSVGTPPCKDPNWWRASLATAAVCFASGQGDVATGIKPVNCAEQWLIASWTQARKIFHMTKYYFNRKINLYPEPPKTTCLWYNMAPITEHECSAVRSGKGTLSPFWDPVKLPLLDEVPFASEASCAVITCHTCKIKNTSF